MLSHPIQREVEVPPFMTMSQNVERRRFRRHDLEQQEIIVERWDAVRKTGTVLGKILDLSAGGIRIRTGDMSITKDTQIRLRLSLPQFAGISPFIDHDHGIAPANEWVGWLVVSRVQKTNSYELEIAGRLVDMDEVDRGMLGLYLSTQPLAA